MNTKVNKEYKKLIDKLNSIQPRDTKSSTILREIEYGLKQLGTESVFSPDIERFRTLTAKMLGLYIRKNSDYGNSFEQSLDEEGIAAYRIRMGDKWLRFKNLSKQQAVRHVQDETIEDTLIDMANYSVMTLAWLNKNKEKKE